MDVFDAGASPGKAVAVSDLKTLHAKLGPLALDNEFLTVRALMRRMDEQHVEHPLAGTHATRPAQARRLSRGSVDSMGRCNISNEEVCLHAYETVGAVHRRVGSYLEFYNPPSSTQRLTARCPMRFTIATFPFCKRRCRCLTGLLTVAITCPNKWGHLVHKGPPQRARDVRYHEGILSHDGRHEFI